MIIRALGTPRFGVLTLAWSIIGYFSFLDLGLGRALTKTVAEKLGSENEEQVPDLVWTTLSMMLALGIAGTLALSAMSPWLVYHVLKIPVDLRGEAGQSFVMLAVSIPIVIVSSGLGGILAAKQRFGIINAIRTPFGILMSAGPLLVIPFSHRLQAIIAVLLAIRLLNLAIQFIICIRILPALRKKVSVKKHLVMPLISYGGWMTVSNVIGPFMVYADRFFISAFISMAGVAYYTPPYEVVTKLWIIPSAIVGVLFPAFSASFSTDLSRAMLLYKRSLK